MVILITGASHVGKTLLAQKMLEKYDDSEKGAVSKLLSYCKFRNSL